MLERFKQFVVPVALVLAIGAGVSIVWQTRSSNPTFGRLIYYRCDAGHDFSMTVQQVSDHHLAHYGQPIPCPICGSKHVTPADGPPHPPGAAAHPAP